MSPLDLMVLALRRIRLLVGLPIAFAVLAVVYVYTTAEYAADASFRPQVAEMDASRLVGIAAQLGFSMPSSGGESLHFYTAVLRSRSVLTEVIRTEYVVQPEDDDVVRGDLIDLLDIEEDSERRELLVALAEMDERIEVQTDIESGIIRFRVVAPWGQLAESVAARMLDLLNDYNLARRQSQASQERSFVESRLADTQAELQAAEAQLRAFLDDNRTYQASPRLVFEQARLQRQVDLQQALHATLAQAFEQARIEEVRNTPVVTIIDRPEGSARSAANPVAAVLLALIFGGVVAITVLLLQIWWRVQHDRNPEALARVRRNVAYAGRRLTGRRAAPEDGTTGDGAYLDE